MRAEQRTLVADMDVRITALRPVGEAAGTALRCATVGCWHRRTHRTEREPTGLYLMWITHGGGELAIAGRTWTIAAPAIVILRPGAVVRYGPRTWWRERFAIVGRGAEGALAARIPWWPAQPCWTLRTDHLIEALLDAWSATLAGRGRAWSAARWDAVVETLLQASIEARGEPVADQLREALRQRVARASADPAWMPDPDRLAVGLGVSRATLFRAWRSEFGLAPIQWGLRRRLDQVAADLLREPGTSVAEIARRAGFSDPLHCSRRFAARYGCSPSAYRRRSAT